MKFSGSVAPIEAVGKPVTNGIAMDPALKGVWKWTDDRTLTFKPAQDWPVGFHADVQFDTAKAIAPHVLLADDHFSFDTPAFAASTGTGEFYQDPQNPAAKKTIMKIAFNYPVDPAEFEKRISLALKGRAADGTSAAPIGFTVTYDAVKLNAWVHSQPLALPRDNDAVKLTLDSGSCAARAAGEPTKDPLSMSVNVPGLYSLRATEVTPTLVNNDRFEPEQVLVVSTTDAVRGSDLAGLVKAWVLPKRKPGVEAGRRRSAL